MREGYPDERDHVNQREKEISDLWDGLQRKAAERKKKLADAEQQQRFKEQAGDLENWLGDVKKQCREREAPHNVAEAEELLNKHADLASEIDANRDKCVTTDVTEQCRCFLKPCTCRCRFQKLAELGQAILAKDPNNKEVADEMRRLADEQRQLDDLWRQKNADLENARALQVFLREADQIDSVSASHEAFLEFDDLGVSLHRDVTAMLTTDCHVSRVFLQNSIESVDTLLKRHEDFGNTLAAQEKTVGEFDQLASNMIEKRHPESEA